MAIPKDEHAKYLQDVEGFLMEVGADLTNIELYKSAGMRFIYEGGGNSGAKKEATGYSDGNDDPLCEGEELGDCAKGFAWYTGAHVMVKISGPRDKGTDGMDIGLIKEIPDDIKIKLEPEEEQYTLDDVNVFASVLNGEYDMCINGRKITFPHRALDKITAEDVEFFEKTFIPAAEKHGIVMDKDFVLRMEYYRDNKEQIEYERVVGDFLGKINAKKAFVEGSTGVLVHARALRFELSLDGKDIVWFDVNERVNDIEYEFITMRIDEVAKELGFTFHDGPEPDAAEGLTPQPQQPPRPMPSMPPSKIKSIIPPIPPPPPLYQTEPPELLPSWVLEVSPEQLNAAQGSPATEQTNHKVKKVMKKVKKQ
jgi:hypothetical protein